MTPAGDASPPRAPQNRLERLVRVYEHEIYPLFDRWFTAPLLARLRVRPVGPVDTVLDLGAASGHLAEALGAQGPRTLVCGDPSGAMLALLRARVPVGRSAALVRGGTADGLPFRTASFDRVFARGRADEALAPLALLPELVRVCRPGGELAFTVAMQGTWAEPLDLLDEALERRGFTEARNALFAYRAQAVTAEDLEAALTAAGVAAADVTIEEKQVLFRSGREFFFSALVELGPLRRWKALTGRGETLQSAFAAMKTAIDTYYRGRTFSVTLRVATVLGQRPRAS
ncbi:MAG: class I SAM-dependent methyltransferase [Myxococcales bacterium]|nr:class I SAM-dependent methyltransferase [Myxococcales bacterium]